MCHTAVTTVPGVSTSIAQARAWLQVTLADSYRDGHSSRELAADAAVVVSELAGNAVQAGATTVRVTATMHSDTLTVSVTDDARGTPRQQPPTHDAASGRGLNIVAALSVDWGTHSTGASGTKTVWSTLAVAATVERSFHCRADPRARSV